MLHEHELQAKLVEQTGVVVCLSTICRFLHRIGFSYQRLRIVAVQRDDFLRAQFVSDVSIYEPEMLIFLQELTDETPLENMATASEGSH